MSQTEKTKDEPAATISDGRVDVVDAARSGEHESMQAHEEAISGQDEPFDESEIAANLGDRYEIVSLIGRGGMGSVYTIRDRQLDKTFAVKVLNRQFAGDPSAISRFEREATAAQGLTHPNLAAIYNHGVGTRGLPFILMDYLDGKTVEVLLNEEGRFETHRALLIAIQVAEAVAYAHAKGVVHRDLKPANIIIQRMADEPEGEPGAAIMVCRKCKRRAASQSTGSLTGWIFRELRCVCDAPELHEADKSSAASFVEIAKVVDFGIAKIAEVDGRPAQQLTKTGEIFGSPLYMSPEQCLGNEQDARSDVYALGCVIYEMLTGEPPLKGENPVKTIVKHIEETPVPPSVKAQRIDVPKDIDNVVMHCLEKKPADRYQNAADLVRDLQSALEGNPVEIYNSSVRLSNKKKRIALYKKSAAAVVIIATMAGAWMWDVSHPSQSPSPSKAPAISSALSGALSGDADSKKSAQELEALGTLYRWGKGDVAVDYPKAARYFEMAAKKGRRQSYLYLGYMYEEGLGVPKDSAKAFEIYLKGAELGDVVCQHNVGCMYDEGNGVKQSYVEALKWYTKAAEQDYPFSQINIGVLYERGHGVKQDYKKAFDWNMRAANARDPDKQAFFNIGTYYENGLGVQQDYKKAFSWYARALQHGYTYALVAMGEYYRDGIGVQRDYDKAIDFFERASREDIPSADTKLGTMYSQGLGVQRDYKKAALCFKKAADRGDMEARFRVGLLYVNGAGVARDEKKGLELLESVAKTWNTPDYDGDPIAQLGLGTMSEYGYGMPKSKEKAFAYYKKSAALKNEEASTRLKALERSARTGTERAL